jgi:hypothetical protein
MLEVISRDTKKNYIPTFYYVGMIEYLYKMGVLSIIVIN